MGKRGKVYPQELQEKKILKPDESEQRGSGS